jgi:phosphohistidine phosphatase SixA
MRKAWVHALACAVASLALLPAAVRAADADDEALWALLAQQGQVVLMRHAVTTPGVGDPPGMSVDDCSTQRTLTEEGRRQAKRIGAAMRARSIRFDRVISSPMCRCLETAQLAFGRVDEKQHIGNPRGGGEARETRAVATEARRGNTVLVSHGSIIYAVAAVHVEPGDMLVVTPRGDGTFEVRGRLRVAAP